MRRSVMLLVRRRLTWLLLLLAVWLLCSGQAQAGPLGDRIQQFPTWPEPPALGAAQGDLAYPDWFQGTWQLTSTLVDLTAPLAPELTTPGFKGNQALLEQPITCLVRFVAVPRVSQGLVPLVREGVDIVSDRAFNGLSMAKAYLRDDRVKAVKVDPDNPNRQITLLNQGRQLESTVTARATEAIAPDQFVTAERFQQVFRGTTVPYLNQVDILTNYRHTPTGIAADQITAVYLSPYRPKIPTFSKL
jgi:hypothetical protein